MVVRVPGWRGTHASAIHLLSVLDRPGVLRQQCSKRLADGGSITVLRAVTPGQVVVGAPVTPMGNIFVPSWGGIIVINPRLGSSSAPSHLPQRWQQLYCTTQRGAGESRGLARSKMGKPSNSGSGPSVERIPPFSALFRLSQGQSWDEWAIPVPNGLHLYVLAIYQGSTVSSTHWYSPGNSDLTALCQPPI